MASVVDGGPDPKFYSRWGHGQWRPLVRVAVWQEGAQKYRIIDNGRAGGHNHTLSTDERIHTASVESGVAKMRRLRRHVGPPCTPVGPSLFHPGHAGCLSSDQRA